MIKEIDFLRLHERLLDTITTGDIPKLMSVCYEEVGTPILCVDTLYNVYGIAPYGKTGDKAWDILLTERALDTDYMATLYEEGVMQSVNKKKAPFVVDWGLNAEFPKIQGVITVNGIIEGYVTMQCNPGEITEERIKAMDIIQKVCSLLFKEMDTDSVMSGGIRRGFIEKLLNGQIYTRRQFSLWQKDAGITPTPPFSVTAVTLDGPYEKNVLTVLARSLTSIIPNFLSIIQDEILYIVSYGKIWSSDDPLYKSIIKNIEKLFEKYSAYGGVSNTFEDLFLIGIYKKQAEDAMRLKKMYQKKETLCFYNRVSLAAILDPRIQEMDEVSYISPLITLLKNYDDSHETDLLITLKHYVSNICRTKETAEILHIHRNTLLYRIGKIEELGQVSLHDPELFLHLMISFYMEDHNK